MDGSLSRRGESDTTKSAEAVILELEERILETHEFRDSTLDGGWRTPLAMQHYW
jgi:hypothetical protein